VADVLWQDIVALQANLSTVSAAAQMIILAYVNEDLEPDVFGGEDSPRYHLARCYLAAHLGGVALANGGMSVSSQTIGTTSITIAFAAVNSAGEALFQTSWGLQYAALLQMSPLRLGVGCL
jgi:hypothetical protein